MGVFRIDTDQGTFDLDVEADSLSPEQAQQLLVQEGLVEAAPEGPSLGRRVAATGLRVGAGLTGAAIGGIASGGNPFVAAGGAGIASGLVAPFAARIEGRTASIPEVIGEAAAASIPGGLAAKTATKIGGGLAVRAGLGALEGAAQGALGTEVATRIGQGRAPTAEERITSAGLGAAFGGVFDALFGASAGAGVKQAEREAALRAPKTLDDAGLIPASDSLVARRAAKNAPLVPTPERPGDRRFTIAEGDPLTTPRETPADILPEGNLPPEEMEFYTPEGKPVEGGPQLFETKGSLESLKRLQDDTEARLIDALISEGSNDPGLRGRRVTLRVAGMVERGDFDAGEFYKLLDENELSVAEGAQILKDTVSNSARNLNVMSQISKDIQRHERLLAGADFHGQLLKDAEGAGTVSLQRVYNEIKDLDNVGRAMAIGQLATAVRNFITQKGRLVLDLPLETLQQAAVNTSVGRKIFKGVINNQKKRIGNPIATLYASLRALTPGDTDRLLDMFDRMGTKGKVIERNLFGGQSLVESPVTQSNRARAIRGLPSRMVQTYREGRAEGKVVKSFLGPIADAATALNQLQENYFRRARFQATLEARARAKGHSWADVVADPKVLGADDFADAIDDSLEVSFAVEPTDGLGKSFVYAMRKAQPISTVLAPYPRYMVNAGRFMADFNPLGTLRLLEQLKSERNLGREFEILTRGMAGTAMLGAATMFQMSDRAGERWYEAKGEDGERINLIGAAGPFLPLLFMGRLVAGALDPETPRAPVRSEDFAQGSIGLRLSPGSQAMLDLSKKAFGGGLDNQEGVRLAERIAGEFVSRFTVPLRTVKDFMGEYSREERLYYDPREILDTPAGGTRVLNPTVQNIPGLGGKLERPPGVSVATGKERESVKTGQRQLTGLTTRESTPLQREMDVLGFDEFEFNPKSGNPKVDRILARLTGTAANRDAPALLADPRYKNASVAVKRKLVGEFMKGAAKEAREAADEAFPQLAISRKLSRLSKKDKEIIQEQRGVNVDDLVQELMGQILPRR